MDWAVVTIVVQLIFLEGILSIDNAAVLGAMVAHLPNDRPIPWPPQLRFLAGWSQRTLGNQRDAALKVGLLGAYLGRGLMLAIAGIIAGIIWMRILGAAYLLYLALNHLAELHQHHEEHREQRVRTGSGFWATVGAIELADLAFSIDNVIAAVALSNEFWVVMLGVAIGILVMRFAASIFTRMIAWEPALQTGAFLLLLAIGVELLLRDVWHVHIDELLQFVVSVGILALTVIVARTPLRHPVIAVSRPLTWLMAQLKGGLAGLFGLLALPFRRKSLDVHDS